MSESTTKNKRKYTLDEKLILSRDYAKYGDSVTPEAKRIVSGNQSGTEQSNSYGTTSAFTPSANYNNAMNLTNSILSNLAKVKPVDSVKSMLANIQSRPKFAYDINNDALFQQALSSAQKSGKTAMKDTMGQAASLTGGYGSSYSTAVGNKAYNDNIQRVYDNIPQYYNMALQTHQAETDELYKQYALMLDANNTEYQRLLDAYNISYGQAQDIYNKDYAKWMDANDLAYRERDWEYGVGRDTLEDQRRDKEWEYNVEQDILKKQQTDAEWNNYLEQQKLDNEYRDAEWDNYLEQQKLDNEYRDAEWDNYLEQQAFENQLRGDIDRNGILSPEEMAYLQETNDTSNKLSNGKDSGYMTTYKTEALAAYYNNNSDEYLDSLDLNETEKEEIKAYVKKHTDENPIWVGGSVGAKKFRTVKGDNFEIEYNDTAYKFENKGKVENTGLVAKLQKINAKNNVVILFDGALYFKHDGEFYKVGNPSGSTATQEFIDVLNKE